MTNKELVEKLREHADWADANEWEAPITLGDDLRAAADALEAMRWVPVTERLPENGVPVIVNYIGNSDGKYHPDATAVWTDYGCFWWEGSLEDCDIEVAVPITHWMPLPRGPEEAE